MACRSEGKIAWSGVIHDAAEQYDMHCSVGHRYHDYKSAERNRLPQAQAGDPPIRHKQLEPVAGRRCDLKT